MTLATKQHRNAQTYSVEARRAHLRTRLARTTWIQISRYPNGISMDRARDEYFNAFRASVGKR